MKHFVNLPVKVKKNRSVSLITTSIVWIDSHVKKNKCKCFKTVAIYVRFWTAVSQIVNSVHFFLQLQNFRNNNRNNNF